MQYAILLQQQADGRFQASVPAMAGLTHVADTRDEVLHAVQQALSAALQNTELVYLDVPAPQGAQTNPWLATAGWLADDETLEPMLQDVYADRDAE